MTYESKLTFVSLTELIRPKFRIFFAHVTRVREAPLPQRLHQNMLSTAQQRDGEHGRSVSIPSMLGYVRGSVSHRSAVTEHEFLGAALRDILLGTVRHISGELSDKCGVVRTVWR